MRNSPATVVVSRCPSYRYEQVEASLHEVLEPLGGMGAFVRPGHRVLLKVNLLAAKAPEKGITTHPAVLEAVAREVKRWGGKPIVADSPAGVMGGIQRFWKNTGIGDAVERFGGSLFKLEGKGVKAFSVNGNTYYLSSILDEVDVVINLPKLKTHGLTLYTGAVKNCFGLIPGFRKSEFHKMAPKVDRFSSILVDVFSAVMPSLNIMDGILGLEGNGPSTSGSPRQVGLLMASPDAVALDAAAAQLIGLEPRSVSTTRIAAARGLGRDSGFDLVGPELAELKITDYKLPSNYYLRLVPAWLVKLMGRFVWVRPEAKGDKCTSCGICIKNCPVGAMRKGKGGIPDIDYSVCINCLSCDESCPEEAMEQKVSWLARKLT